MIKKIREEYRRMDGLVLAAMVGALLFLSVSSCTLLAASGLSAVTVEGQITTEPEELPKKGKATIFYFTAYYTVGSLSVEEIKKEWEAQCKRAAPYAKFKAEETIIAMPTSPWLIGYVTALDAYCILTGKGA